MKTLLERFKQNVMMLDDSDDSCWVWVGYIKDDGRGWIRVAGKRRRAHRVAWELLNGRPIPDGMRLVQECAHPQCVRHWRLDRPWKKLSDDEVRAIRGTSIPSHALAVRFGVSSCYIRRIRCGAERASVFVGTDGTTHTESRRPCV